MRERAIKRIFKLTDKYTLEELELLETLELVALSLDIERVLS